LRRTNCWEKFLSFCEMVDALNRAGRCGFLSEQSPLSYKGRKSPREL
jgi:hypothetical protein